MQPIIYTVHIASFSLYNTFILVFILLLSLSLPVFSFFFPCASVLYLYTHISPCACTNVYTCRSWSRKMISTWSISRSRQRRWILLWSAWRSRLARCSGHIARRWCRLRDPSLQSERHSGTDTSECSTHTLVHVHVIYTQGGDEAMVYTLAVYTWYSNSLYIWEVFTSTEYTTVH